MNKKVIIIISMILLMLMVGIILFIGIMGNSVDANNNIETHKIVLTFPLHTDEIKDDNDTGKIEITGDNLTKIYNLIDNLSDESCDCSYKNEMMLTVDDKYSINFGKENDNAIFGYKSSDGKTGITIPIDKELYDSCNELIDEYKKNNNITNNDDIDFELDNEYKYRITTNLWNRTLRNDGGSFDSEYYNIDLKSKTVIKIYEKYEANLDTGNPKTTKTVTYNKKISNELNEELKELIDSSESDYIENKYDQYLIEGYNYKVTVYNDNPIKKIEDLLKKIDNY